VAKVAVSEADRRIREAATEGMQQAEGDLRTLRNRIRRADLIPPPLPPELADVDQPGQDHRPQVRRAKYRPVAPE